MEEQPIVNRVANSSLVSIDLEEYIPDVEKIEMDLADYLFQRMILREKDFRTAMKELELDRFRDKAVRVHCSEDAIIPSWAYMLLVSKLSPEAYVLVVGDDTDLEKAIIDKAIESIPLSELEDRKVVIKGCGGIELRDYTYFQVTKRLLPYVTSLMYGEPCSTVPVFKKKK